MASDGSTVQSLDRALSILGVLRLSGSSLALGDVAARAGLPKSTTHRLLATLQRHGLVVRDGDGARYQLAARTFEPVGAGPRVREILEELAATSRETANLGALIGAEVLYADRASSPQALRWQLGVGSRVPAHCSAMGKAILASLSPGEVARLLPARLERFTAGTMIDRETLMGDLSATRTRGYAVDEEEFMEGVRCVAVLVGRSPAGILHAVSIAGPAFRFTRDRAEGQVEAMRRAAARVHRVLDAGRPLRANA